MQPLELTDLTNAQLLKSHFTGIQRGIEKESLRINADGSLSQKPHPFELGATLTNRYITTDYSEALPELITSPTDDRLKPLAELTEIHQFLNQSLGEELLWGMSMPCIMGNEEDIPIARYGSSNGGKMKEVYRLGLGHRYGRFMQTISGVHYNFSLPLTFWQALHQQENSRQDLQSFISEKYMGLIRNYLRYSWLIPLFYGASPALCESFLKNKNVDLAELVSGTRYGPYATSLRMSDLGYQNQVQSRLNVSYNSLDKYLVGLEKAISTPDPYYQELGIKKEGEYIQLNENILQIENEFYSSIRPKRVARSGERPSIALRNDGVEYIEIRALDINPFSNIGIEQSQISFIDSFLITCLLSKSAPINQRESGEVQENFRAVVRKGRHPELCLTHKNQCVPLVKLAKGLLKEISQVSVLLDDVYQTSEHSDVIEHLSKQLDNLDETFSGRIISDIKETKQGFFPYAMALSREHQSYFNQHPLSPEKMAFYQEEATTSHKKKNEIEQSDTISFEQFLANYYA